MGTRSLPDARWLVPDHLAESELALRNRLLDEQRPLVFACRAVAEPAAEEAATLIDRWLSAHTELPARARDPHPLAQVGRRIQEDLCLMVHRDGGWRLEAAVLCFPSLWVLSEKLGQPLAGIHQPVAHYADELATKVDTFFDRLSPSALVGRRNFSIWPTNALWAPCRRLDQSLHQAPIGDDPPLWLRSERQTLHRLPETGAILFTIRVQTAPMSALRARPDRSADLARWLRSASGTSRRSELGPMAGVLLSWLDAQAAGYAHSG